jgi:hypothetical protein
LTQTGEIGEAVETDESLEIANTHAVFVQVAENMVGCQKRLGEYPTLSAIFSPQECDLKGKSRTITPGFRCF